MNLTQHRYNLRPKTEEREYFLDYPYRIFQEDNARKFVFSCCCRGRRIGVVEGTIFDKKRHVLISRLFVNKAYRSAGVGRSLMENIIHCYGFSYSFSLLACPYEEDDDDDMKYALKVEQLREFYESLGFVVDSISHENPYEIAYVMSRKNDYRKERHPYFMKMF